MSCCVSQDSQRPMFGVVVCCRCHCWEMVQLDISWNVPFSQLLFNFFLSFLFLLLSSHCVSHSQNYKTVSSVSHHNSTMNVKQFHRRIAADEYKTFKTCFPQASIAFSHIWLTAVSLLWQVRTHCSQGGADKSSSKGLALYLLTSFSPAMAIASQWFTGFYSVTTTECGHVKKIWLYL